MKKLILLIFSSLTFTISKAQTPVTIDEVSEHLLEEVLVCDSVYSGKVLSHLTFVDIGNQENHPIRQAFSLPFFVNTEMSHPLWDEAHV